MSAQALDHGLLQQAADWYARLAGQPGDLALQQAWEHWLAAAEAHRQAWAFVEQVSERFAPLQPQAASASHALGQLRRGGQSRRAVLRGLSTVAGVSVLGWLGWQGGAHQAWLAWQADYRTGVGRIEERELADGTRLWLNSASAVDVRFDARHRSLYLYRGEVLISTAEDARPLQVHTRDGRLQPLGTRFSVLQGDDRTQLTVFAGEVLGRCAASGLQQRVAAGRAVSFDSQRFTSQHEAPAMRESWRDGVLLARDTDLRSLVAELARYRTGYLGVAPELADLRIMGAYPLQDTDQALEMLARTLPVRIERRLPWWVSVEPAD
ncbi:MAG: FecR domain-containing protein [Candidatus Pseudomonas phytovorans]|uniref:FecR domain-containing protein n=1 Tax=Candidatus Pseudomonas phytovorans TaxID=3121377 RepID=A0AAJ5WF89_9PSED|nr:FecR domain-containing protein [Pseudomonas sp.]WEK28618.1 MAG: FecR domain-containing protein [Pseudomonas sp.]